MHKHSRILFLAGLCCLCGGGIRAQIPESSVNWEAQIRLRQEWVEDSSFGREAQASTLRLRLAMRAAITRSLSALLEGEGITALDHHYNSGANGRSQFPLVPDAPGVELNQAWLGWNQAQLGITLGRQRVQIDNQRWVGNSGWRQNEQTFDAASLNWKVSATTLLRYHWLNRVLRVNGPDARDRQARARALNTHLLDLQHSQADQSWALYSYAHEDQDVASASTLSTGLRWLGNRLEDGQGWSWRAEFAHQREYANNPLQFSHNYWLLEPAFTRAGVTTRFGWEHLGGNGQHALQTPLATLHAFNGWADRFLVTPAGGLEDRYFSCSGNFGNGPVASTLKWTLAWHDFRADKGGDFGEELDAALSFPVHGRLSGLLKIANFDGTGSTPDSRKLWLQLEWTH